MYFSSNSLRSASLHGYVTPPDETKGEKQGAIAIYPFGLKPEGQVHLSLSIAEAEEFAALLTKLAQDARNGDYSSYEKRGNSN